MYTHKDLIPIAYKWAMMAGSCGVAFKELNTRCSNGEYPDILGMRGNGTLLIEVKATISDFLSDKNKKFRKNPALGMGDFRFYLCPTNLIKISELPENWGLIYVNADGKARCVHNPYCKSALGNIWGINLHTKNHHAEHGLFYSAFRRLHIKGYIDSIYDKNYVRGYVEDFAKEKENTKPTLF